ncbi:multi-sensor signal transduction histidine kinase [Cylindrospermum sp. NIES-4074]|nr:multi-sensor signal transduction histidine kinase [Cylindrospermum sp. NIES-4074]
MLGAIFVMGIYTPIVSIKSQKPMSNEQCPITKELPEQTEQVQLQEAQLRMALDAARLGIWNWDLQSNKITESDNLETLFGLEKGSFSDTYEAFLNCIHPQDRDFVKRSHQQAIGDGVEYDIEFRVVLPDGSIRWLASKGVVLHNSSGVSVQMYAVDMDITKRKQAEAALEVHANQQAIVAELSQIALAGTDLTTLMNKSVTLVAQCLKVESCKVLELLADGNKLLLRAGVGWEQGAVGQVIVSTVMHSATGYTLVSQEPLIVHNSSQVVSGMSVVIHGKERPFGVLGVHTSKQRTFTRDDIYFLQAVANVLATTIERQRVEEALKKSEERWQLAVSATNDVLWDWDLLTNQVWWNQAVQTLFGYTTEQVNSNISWWRDRIHPDDRQRITAEVGAVIDSGQQFWSNEYRFLRSDGSYAFIFDRGYVVHDNTGKPVRMIRAMMDMSDRKCAQAELLRQNLRSQLFADVTLKIRQSLQIDEILQASVTEVQKLLQADRVLILQLQANDSLLAVKEAVVPGLPIVLGEKIVDPCLEKDYIHKFRQGRISTITDIEQIQIHPCHLELLQKFSVKANLVVPIFLKNQLWGLLIAHQCLHPRQWTNWEIELLRQLADQIGIALAQSLILEQETNQRQELTRSNEELQQFAFIASHDLQEPLRKIKTFGERIKASCGESLNEQGQDYLERMQNAALRMQTLIEDLLALSRVTTRALPFVSVNLKQITQEVLSDLEIRIQQTGGRVEVGELPTIQADPLQMRQLLQNLIGNALKFHRQQEVPIVKIYSQFLNNNLDKVTVGAELCQIIVEDNGIGFAEKYLDRIFNVFQRLHSRSEYEGTGIGLAICRKITERHHGSITAQSNPGQGAKFIITLPINSHS